MVVNTTPPTATLSSLRRWARLGLHRRLAQKFRAARERAEELVVEIIAVGDDNDRGILHRRVQDHAPGVKSHGQALARSLRVPHHAHASVAGLTARPLPRLVPPNQFADRPSFGRA